MAYDKYKENYTNKFDWVEEVSLENIQENADIISFHLPLNEETKHFCNQKFIDKCKDEVIFINTSRGQVIETQALIKGLKSGKINGACLDVFENEKPHLFSNEEDKMYNELYDFEQVILSPHVAGWTYESKYKLSKVILHKLKYALK